MPFPFHSIPLPKPARTEADKDASAVEYENHHISIYPDSSAVPIKAGACFNHIKLTLRSSRVRRETERKGGGRELCALPVKINGSAKELD